MTKGWSVRLAMLASFDRLRIGMASGMTRLRQDFDAASKDGVEIMERKLWVLLAMGLGKSGRMVLRPG
jgi:hypothetical protein